MTETPRSATKCHELPRKATLCYQGIIILIIASKIYKVTYVYPMRNTTKRAILGLSSVWSHSSLHHLLCRLNAREDTIARYTETISTIGLTTKFIKISINIIKLHLTISVSFLPKCLAESLLINIRNTEHSTQFLIHVQRLLIVNLNESSLVQFP